MVMIRRWWYYDMMMKMEMAGESSDPEVNKVPTKKLLQVTFIQHWIQGLLWRMYIVFVYYHHQSIGEQSSFSAHHYCHRRSKIGMEQTMIVRRNHYPHYYHYMTCHPIRIRRAECSVNVGGVVFWSLQMFPLWLLHCSAIAFPYRAPSYTRRKQHATYRQALLATKTKTRTHQ